MKNEYLIGKTIREYRIVERLGHGGMAVVYKVEHLLLKTYRAMKIIRGDVSDNPVHVARFEREARLLVGLDHPNLVRVYDFFRESGSLFLVMEFVPGESLAARLKKAGSLPVAEVHEIVEQVCAGLAYAHSRGIIHRDLSPDNIMITHRRDGSEHIQIIDFGIAKALENEAEATMATFQTTSGKFVGKPSYCSPEQARANPVDHRTDIYSLGLIVFRALTGGMAFESRTYLDTILSRTTRPPRTLAEAAPGKGFGQDLENVIARALARNPGDRYDSVDSFLAAIRKAFRHYYRIMDQRDATERRVITPVPAAQAAPDEELMETEMETGSATIRIPEMIPAPAPKPKISPPPAPVSRVSPAAIDQGEPASGDFAQPPKKKISSLMGIFLMVAVMIAMVAGSLYAIRKMGLGNTILSEITGTKQPETRRSIHRNTRKATPAPHRPATPSPVPTVHSHFTVPPATPTRTPSFTPTATPSGTPTSPPSPEPVHTTPVSAGLTAALPAFQMIPVTGNTFTRFDDHHVEQTVEITHGFLMGATEVTRALYQAVIGSCPEPDADPNLPVTGVSWYEAVEFCNRLSEMEGRSPAYRIERFDRRYTISWQVLSRGYRLPTEAEWELAGRGHTPVRFTSGESLRKTDAWFDLTAGPHPCGRLSPNFRGIYDIHGNVREWVWDGFGPYTPDHVRNPGGNPAAETRVVRGGSWKSPAADCAFTRRVSLHPYEKDDLTGFRIARLK